jgi:hypothetical protein
MRKDSELVSITDADGKPRYGLHQGSLPSVDLRQLKDPRHASALWRVTHHKRWAYCAVTSEHNVVAAAVVHLGYAANAFVFALDRRSRSMLFDRSYVGLPQMCRVSDGCEEGFEAVFRAPRAHFSLTRARGASVYTLEVRAHDLSLRASFDASCSPTPISVIAPVPQGSVHLTEKRVLMPVRGQLLIGDRFARLDEAVAGLDYTQAFLARHTSWRWALCMGRTTDGRPIAFNLVEGFNAGRECVVWLDGEVLPVQEPKFAFEPERPLGPWKIQTPDGTLDLRFKPDAVHAERRNLGLVRSHFVQPAGSFSGSFELAGHRPGTLESSPGVVEHQDVLW